MLDALFNELRNAFQDVRQKVVEEGWFGRVVTAALVIEVDASDSCDRRSLEEMWAPPAGLDRGGEVAPKAHDHGIDL
jgi:hypothetical protein